jgi:hypothetical protein
LITIPATEVSETLAPQQVDFLLKVFLFPLLDGQKSRNVLQDVGDENKNNSNICIEK